MKDVEQLKALRNAVIAYPDADVFTCCDHTIAPLEAEVQTDHVETAILAAIEPYRLVLASVRNLLEKAPVKDGYLN